MGGGERETKRRQRVDFSRVDLYQCGVGYLLYNINTDFMEDSSIALIEIHQHM